MATSKLLVTGCRGQLGSDLVDFLGGSCDVVGVDLPELDIRREDQVTARLKQINPDVILHAAAFTDVDRCEDDPVMAGDVNARGTENVARAARAIGARVIYYSTDYVFDGDKTTPYRETDPTGPRTEYGRSKLAGEQALSDLVEDHVILRIAWLYGKRGKNFVRTMIRLGTEQMRQVLQVQIITPLKVVDDQIGSPTWTKDVVRQTEKLIDSDLTGVFHATAEGETSWYGLTCKLFETLDMAVQVRPCTSEEFPRPAPRPKYSVLENARLKQAGIHCMRPWQQALSEFLGRNGD